MTAFLSRLIRVFSLRIPALSTVFSLVFLTFATAQELEGTYRGMDGARGITIQLARGGNGYVGEIASTSGGGATLNAEAVPGGARGPLMLQGQPGTVELTARPVGLSMVWRPDSGGSELVYAFRREQLALPAPPAGYTDPPPPGATRVNPLDFLNSYEFWEAAQVARTYDGLDDKYRVIIKTFATVHTDVLWKLCRAPTAPAQLVDALRGQGVNCVDVQKKIKASQETGGFMRFKQAVRVQKVDALLAIECARGINTADICTRAAQRTQQAALSLQTAGSVLEQF